MTRRKKEAERAEKINEAINALQHLGFPRHQQNKRSALTLLVLLGLKPGDPWSLSKNPMLGITQMMDHFETDYSKKYAPNSRETVRRQTIHQFLQAALVVMNPDRPDRPTNSGKTVYQIDASALELLRRYGTPEWGQFLAEYRKARPSLRDIYNGRRAAGMIQLRLPSGWVSFSTGEHNKLIEKICTVFLDRHVRDGMPLYVGDTAKKFAHFDKKVLLKLGIKLDPHGKAPDVIIYDKRRNWLFLVEAVSSHGPIDAKRRRELHGIFADSSAGLVYVTAFADKSIMKKHIEDVSWETEVWVAESPDHMIHFDGKRFLGPYST